MDGLVICHRKPLLIFKEKSPLLTNLSMTMRNVGFIPVRKQFPNKQVFPTIETSLKRVVKNFPKLIKNNLPV